MIPSLETERVWVRPVRLEDAEQVQKKIPRGGRSSSTRARWCRDRIVSVHH
jgi:hypothetical protein